MQLKEGSSGFRGYHSTFKLFFKTTLILQKVPKGVRNIEQYNYAALCPRHFVVFNEGKGKA